MKNVKKNFPFYNTNSSIIYFDNAATSLKPSSVIDAINNYYINYSNSPLRSEFILANECEKFIEESYKKAKHFINARNVDEIHFTYNATDSLNIVSRVLQKNINQNDEIIITTIDHSSNIAPWLELAKSTKAKIIWAKPDKNQIITLKEIKRLYSKKTKIVSMNTISNVIGKINEYKKIGNFLKNKTNTFYILDATQSISHIEVNVQESLPDFLAFSFHKMWGPTGLGILYVNNKNIKKLTPANIGGGLIENIFDSGVYTLKNHTQKFVAGTPNYAGIFGAAAAIDFINEIGYENIKKHDQKLINCFKEFLHESSVVNWYNPNPDIPIFCFNIENIFCQDAANILSHNNICVRVGDNCAKMLNVFNKDNKYIRASLSIYNNSDEIKKMFEVINKGGDILHGLF